VIWKLTLLLAMAYVLGSIPWGIILTRHFGGKDIRRSGSGNTGATNVSRVAGPRLGVAVLVADMLKGAFPVWIALRITPHGSPWYDLFTGAVAIAAVLGHLYPVFLGLTNGGKGVATAAGCFLAISPSAFLLSLLIFLILAFFTNTVSAGSLAASATLPFWVRLTTGSMPLAASALVLATLIWLRHRDNIRRLLSGTENTLRQKDPSRDR